MKTNVLQGLGIAALLAGHTAAAQAPYNTISGTVWKEQGIVNNLKDASEAGVPGVMVTLLDANTGATVGNALSDALGAYTLPNYQGAGDYVLQFDYALAGYDLVQKRVGSNNAINSAADPQSGQTDVFTISTPAALTTYNLGVAAKSNTVTYASVKLSELTDWTQNFQLPQSGPEIGVLTRATIYINTTEWHPYFGVENTSGTAVVTSPSSGIQVSVTPPVGAAINTVNAIPHMNTALAAYDGTTDYTGTSGKTWANEFASIAAPARVVSLSSQLNSFRGTGTVAFPATALGTVTLAGGGNLLSQISTRIGASVTVVYEYAGGVLPVTLASFDAAARGSDAALTWTTLSEQSNDRFDIEKSTDGKSFSRIASVKSLAKDGNSMTKLQYTFLDEAAGQGQVFYRLKQVDNDGAYTLSAVKAVFFGQEVSVVLYPNPASDVARIKVNAAAQLRVLDYTGKVLFQASQTAAGIFTVNAGKLPAGNYIVLVEGAGFRASKQLTVVR